MQSHASPFALALALATLLALFSGCSSSRDNRNHPQGFPPSSSSSSSSSGGLELGNVQVHFPPPVSSTEADNIRVRGRVVDAANVAAVHINGVPVESADSLASWSLEVPLDEYENLFVITEEDLDGNVTEVEQLVVRRSVDLIGPRHMVYDPVYNRLLVLDVVQNTLIAVDPQTGAREKLTLSVPESPAPAEDDDETPVTELKIYNTLAMVMDADRHRVLLAQQRNQGQTQPTYLAVDLASGEFSELVSPTIADMDLLNRPLAITVVGDLAYVGDQEWMYLDAENNRVSPSDEGAAVLVVRQNLVYSLNLNTGVKTLVSARDTPDRTLLLGTVTLLAGHSLSDNLYAIDFSSNAYRLIRINRNTGARTLVNLTSATETNDNGDPIRVSLTAPRSLSYDFEQQRLLVLNGTSLLAIDTSDGTVSVLSSPRIPEDGDFILRAPRSLSIDPASGNIYVVEDITDSILQIDLSSGARSFVSGSGLADPSGEMTLMSPSSITLTPDDYRILITDRLLASVYEYHPYSGLKTLVTNPRIGSQGQVEVPVDPIEEVPPGDDDDEGQTPPPPTPDQENPAETAPLDMFFPLASIWNPNRNALLVLDNNNQRPTVGLSLRAPRVVEINASPAGSDGRGATELRMLFNTGTTGLRDLALDAEANTLYVAESTFIRRIIMGNSFDFSFWSTNVEPNQNHQFRNIQGLALDKSRNRLLAVDSALKSVLAVNLATGARTPLSNPVVPAQADQPEFGMPKAIVLDEANNRALVMDSIVRGIIAVDLDSGVRELVYPTDAAAPNPVRNPAAMAWHPVFGYLLILDQTRDTLIAVDPVTQQAVILSR